MATAAGLVGCFAVMRKMTLASDAISHVALPGIAIALPVLHTERGAWHFTALFSNTARAHELSRTRDWVVVYVRADHEIEGQRTIVTETQGPLAGQCVVRGRESECHAGAAATPDRG